MPNATHDSLNQIATIKKQQHLIRVLVAVNLITIGTILLLAADYSQAGGEQSVEQVIFKPVGESQWRISVIENAIRFDVKRWHEGNNPDDSKWKSVAQLAAGLDDFRWVRFDVGDLEESETDREGMASMGIEVDRGHALPYFSAIQSASPEIGTSQTDLERRDRFPYGENVNHATLGFGRKSPPPSGMHGTSTGILSFSPSLTLSEIRPDKWAAKIFNPNPKREPQLELRVGETTKKYSTQDSQ